MTPLNDAIVAAMSQLVDDSQEQRRDPSHSDLEFLIEREGLSAGDPKKQGQTVGKAKRIRATLSWAREHRPDAGSKLVTSLLSHIRGQGGFRRESPNYVGQQAIQTVIKVFDSEGYDLSMDGEIRPKILDNLSGIDLTRALQSYVRRAKKRINRRSSRYRYWKGSSRGGRSAYHTGSVRKLFAYIELPDATRTGVFGAQVIHASIRRQTKFSDAARRECNVRTSLWHQPTAKQTRYRSWSALASKHHGCRSQGSYGVYGRDRGVPPCASRMSSGEA